MLFVYPYRVSTVNWVRAIFSPFKRLLSFAMDLSQRTTSFALVSVVCLYVVQILVMAC